MEEIYMKARAKINLNLEVLDKRADNYHNIKSIFQKVNIYDEIRIRKTDTDDIEIVTNIGELNSTDNIIYKAYIMLKEKYKTISGIEVMLNKKIPMQAGMAGGSTDCAVFITCINKLFNLNLSKEEMQSIGKNLGADVVPCFYNTALLAEGIGDKITPIDTNFKYYILIIKPEMSCNTKEMYQRLDMKADRKICDTSDNIIKALKTHDVELLADNLYNAFESAIDDKSIIDSIKRQLIENGALGSLMTGSGSCIFGIFKNKQIAKTAYEKLTNKYKTYICTSFNSKREAIF